MHTCQRQTLLTLLAVTCLACTSAGAAKGTHAALAADATVAADAVATDAAGADAAVGKDAGAAADAVAPALPVTLTEAIVKATWAVLADDPTHGLTLTIDVPGHSRWTAGIGMADAEQAIPMQGLDHLDIGSITKTFVAAAVLRDVEAGKLGLYDSVAPLLPEITIDPAITIDMLLGHRSGLFNYTDDASSAGTLAEIVTPEALVGVAVAHPPDFAPGAGYKYSNTNYIVLGLLLQKLHGVPLQEWLRQTLWAPLQLHDVWLDGYEDIGLQHVPGYLAGQPALPFDTSWSWAAGAVAANGSDLCSWVRALYVDGAVVGPSTVAAMVTPSPASVAAGADYGLGTMISHHAGRTLVGHNGSTMGFNAEVFIDQGSGICVAVLTNDFFGVRTLVGQKVWDVLLNGL